MSITIAKHVIFIINQHGCNIDNVILRSTNWKRTPFLFGFRAGNMRRRPPNNGQQSSLSCLPGLAVMAAMAAMAASAPLSLPPCHHFFSNSPSLSPLSNDADGFFTGWARNAGYSSVGRRLSHQHQREASALIYYLFCLHSFWPLN